jgi:CheY-like chemotaxis protein
MEVVGAVSRIRDALPLLDRHDPDVVLADLSLSDRSGMELERAMRRDRRKGRVVILTGLGDMFAAAEAGTTGSGGVAGTGGGAGVTGGAGNAGTTGAAGATAGTSGTAGGGAGNPGTGGTMGAGGTSAGRGGGNAGVSGSGAAGTGGGSGDPGGCACGVAPSEGTPTAILFGLLLGASLCVRRGGPALRNGRRRSN